MSYITFSGAPTYSAVRTLVLNSLFGNSSCASPSPGSNRAVVDANATIAQQRFASYLLRNAARDLAFLLDPSNWLHTARPSFNHHGYAHPYTASQNGYNWGGGWHGGGGSSNSTPLSNQSINNLIGNPPQNGTVAIQQQTTTSTQLQLTFQNAKLASVSYQQSSSQTFSISKNLSLNA